MCRLVHRLKAGFHVHMSATRVRNRVPFRGHDVNKAPARLRERHQSGVTNTALGSSYLGGEIDGWCCCKYDVMVGKVCRLRRAQVMLERTFLMRYAIGWKSGRKENVLRLSVPGDPRQEGSLLRRFPAHRWDAMVILLS